MTVFICLLFISLSSFGQNEIFNHPAAMPTLTISNTKIVCKGGRINGCWKDTASANDGDTVAVQIYYENTSDVVAQSSTVSIQAFRQSSSKVVFKGGIASLSGPRTVGQAILKTGDGQTLKYIPGSARWYPNIPIVVPVTDSEGLLKPRGFHIGQIAPGTQGVIVAFFSVGYPSIDLDPK